MNDIILTETGCYLDNHRGHYISRDVIQLAQGYGFIVGWFEQWAIDSYDAHSHEENYPNEGIIELADEAIAWLNSGQDNCVRCRGTGKGSAALHDYWLDQAGNMRCKLCTGTGRGPRISGQNFPPVIPEGYAWDWNDGDFGLYAIEDMED